MPIYTWFYIQNGESTAGQLPDEPVHNSQHDGVVYSGRFEAGFEASRRVRRGNNTGKYSHNIRWVYMDALLVVSMDRTKKVVKQGAP